MVAANTRIERDLNNPQQHYHTTDKWRAYDDDDDIIRVTINIYSCVFGPAGLYGGDAGVPFVLPND